VCPDKPLLPPTKMVIVVCCSSENKSVQQVRADGRHTQETDWTEGLAYCRITLNKKQNQGLESSAFLHYFTEMYDNLPDRVVMVHGNNGWHDHVTKTTLLAPNFTDWLSPKAGFIPLPAPVTHDGDIDTRNAWTISMQGFYDKQLRDALGLPAKRVCDPGQDRLHYCCAQFALTRETIRRNPRIGYARLRDYVYTENADYRTSRELEHGWPIVFTGTMRAAPSLIAAVEDWRRQALMTPCQPWGCTCQKMSDMFGTSQNHQGTATAMAYTWFWTGSYDTGSEFHQVSVLSSMSSVRAALYTREGRNDAGACTTHPQSPATDGQP
jgi:hypothetical protein